MSFGSTNVQAASSENSDVLINGEKSLDKVMNIISKKIEINEKNIAIQGKATILNSIQQKDIDNINALAKAQGIEYDQPLTKENLLNLFNNGIETINAEVQNGNLEVLADGSLIDANDSDFYVQGGSTYDKTYWWGKKRYKSTYYANKWVSELNTVANVNAGAAVVAGAIFGGFGAIPNGLTAAYAYQLANKVSYKNSLSNRGIIANVTWALVFTTYTQ